MYIKRIFSITENYKFITWTILDGGTYSLQNGHCGLTRNHSLRQVQQNRWPHSVAVVATVSRHNWHLWPSHLALGIFTVVFCTVPLCQIFNRHWIKVATPNNLNPQLTVSTGRGPYTFKLLCKYNKIAIFQIFVQKAWNLPSYNLIQQLFYLGCSIYRKCKISLCGIIQLWVSLCATLIVRYSKRSLLLESACYVDHSHMFATVAVIWATLSRRGILKLQLILLPIKRK